MSGPKASCSGQHEPEPDRNNGATVFIGPQMTKSILSSLLQLKWTEVFFMLYIALVGLVPSTVLGKVLRLFGTKHLQTENDKMKKVASNVWQVRGYGTAFYPQITFNMTVIRLGGDKLAVFNAVNPTKATMAELSELGTVAYIVGLTPFHDTFFSAFCLAYPSAIPVAGENNRSAFATVGVNIKMDLEELVKAEAAIVAAHCMQNVLLRPCGEAVVEFKTEEGHNALLFTDTIQNSESSEMWLTRLPLGWTGLRVANFFKFSVVKDRAAFRDELLRLLSPRVKLLVFSHGPALSGSSEVKRAREAVKKHCTHNIYF